MNIVFIQILRDVDNQASLKTNHKLLPKLGAKCGARRSMSNYRRFHEEDFFQLLKQFTDAVMNDLEPEIFFQFDLWKCSHGKAERQCKAVQYLWLSTLQEKYRVHAPSTAAIMETEEPAYNTRSRPTEPVTAVISNPPDPPYFDAGVCLMDTGQFFS